VLKNVDSKKVEALLQGLKKLEEKNGVELFLIMGQKDDVAKKKLAESGLNRLFKKENIFCVTKDYIQDKAEFDRDRHLKALEEDPHFRDDYFKVTTHVEYTKAIRNPVFMIGCALDNEQLAVFFEDKRCEYRWLLNRGETLVPERDFLVNRVRIDHQDVPVIRTENTPQGYQVWSGSDDLKKIINRRVRVEIEIETKQLKSNRLFSAYLVYPTRGMEISFHYEGANIKNVREVGFFAGKHPYPEVARKEGKSVTLKLSDRTWIFPTSGVTFVWDL